MLLCGVTLGVFDRASPDAPLFEAPWLGPRGPPLWGRFVSPVPVILRFQFCMRLPVPLESRWPFSCDSKDPGNFGEVGCSGKFAIGAGGRVSVGIAGGAGGRCNSSCEGFESSALLFSAALASSIAFLSAFCCFRIRSTAQ